MLLFDQTSMVARVQVKVRAMCLVVIKNEFMNNMAPGAHFFYIHLFLRFSQFLHFLSSFTSSDFIDNFRRNELFS